MVLSRGDLESVLSKVGNKLLVMEDPAGLYGPSIT